MSWADILILVVFGYTIGYAICSRIDARCIKKLKEEIEDQRVVIASLVSERISKP